MATDWTVGQKGQFDIGTDNGSVTYWAVMRFEWVEEYSPSTGLHRISVTPKAKTSVSNLSNGIENCSHYIIGTVKIGGTTVFNQQYSNVATYFYSKNTFYGFTNATNGYATEVWVGPELSSVTTNIEVNLTLVPASSYWNDQSIKTTQSVTGTAISTTAFTESAVWVHNGSEWVECETYIYDGSWKVGTVYVQK